MRFRICCVSAMTILAGVLVALPEANAQQQATPQAPQMTPPAGAELSEQETRSFFDRAEQSLMQAVNEQNYAQIIEWMNDYVSDEASFFVSEEIMVGNDRKSFAVATLSKGDMMRLGRVAVGFLSGMPSQSLDNYSLDIQVTGVTQIAPGAVTTTARITETASLSMPQPEASGQGAAGGHPQSGAETGQASSGSFQIASEANCNLLLRRDGASNQLLIGMTNCQARTQL